jgi:Arc/MetJ-type ribon-helix-helix transcriptional regulator
VKKPKTHMLAVRISDAMRQQIDEKLKEEHGHDQSSMLRALVRLYIAGKVKIPPGELE